MFMLILEISNWSEEPLLITREDREGVGVTCKGSLPKIMLKVFQN